MLPGALGPALTACLAPDPIPRGCWEVPMHLDLSPDEAQILKEAIVTRRREVHEELIHTDDRSFRQELRRMLDHLEGLEAKIQLPAGP